MSRFGCYNPGDWLLLERGAGYFVIADLPIQNDQSGSSLQYRTSLIMTSILNEAK